MNLWQRVRLALWISACCAWAGPAGAEGDADKAAAEALFNQARTMIQAGDFGPACEKLRASQELDPQVGTLLYLADCYERANRLASAWMVFEEARTTAAERKDPRAEIAAVRAAALKPRLVYVVVEVASPELDGLEVRANGRVIPEDAFGTATPVDEGVLTVVASAPGHKPMELKLDVVAGAKEPYRASIPALESLKVMEAAPEPAPIGPAPPVAPAEARDDGSGQRTVAYIVGGVGVAALLASGVFTLLAKGNQDDSLPECAEADPNRCTVRGKSLRDDAVSQASIATIAGIVGGVGVAAGVTIYLTAPGGDDKGASLVLGYGGTF